MSQIFQEQRQFRTYILTDAATRSQLEVVPERGSIITGWQVNGQELLYLDAERFANPELSVRGGIPILFPICGNLPNNSYTHNGQTYTLKQHGFARDLPWTVVEEIQQNGVGIRLQFESDDRTRAVYPFEFGVQFVYQIQGNSLEIHQLYTNRSPEPMPFSTGLHPYFPVSNKATLQFEIPATQYQNQITQTTHPFNNQFDFEVNEIDVAFREITRQTATVTDPDRRTRLTLEYDPTYSTLVFWTVKGKDYYCLEPWSAPRNALNTGDQLIHLNPGATLETIVRFTVEFL
ncbi:MAG TPA: aldose epimerase [Allocoleopsis sp.]